jgi:hypothetical protein
MRADTAPCRGLVRRRRRDRVRTPSSWLRPRNERSYPRPGRSDAESHLGGPDVVGDGRRGLCGTLPAASLCRRTRRRARRTRVKQVPTGPSLGKRPVLLNRASSGERKTIGADLVRLTRQCRDLHVRMRSRTAVPETRAWMIRSVPMDGAHASTAAAIR